MSDIFVSYASEDRAKAEMIAQHLKNEGWSTFWDRTIPVGMTWDEFIGKELEEARCLVVLWSEASIKSAWVKEEAEEGKSRGVLIPILIEEVRPPLGFRGIQVGDLSNWDGIHDTSELQSLVYHVARLIGQSPREAEEQQRSRTNAEVKHKAEEREQVEGEVNDEADAAAKQRIDAEPEHREERKPDDEHEAKAADGPPKRDAETRRNVLIAPSAVIALAAVAGAVVPLPLITEYGFGALLTAFLILLAGVLVSKPAAGRMGTQRKVLVTVSAVIAFAAVAGAVVPLPLITEYGFGALLIAFLILLVTESLSL